MRRPATAARRYAEAAFQIATRDGTTETWQAHLAELAEALSNEALARRVNNPALAEEVRDRVLREVLAWPERDPAWNLVRLLVRRNRMRLAGAIASEFRRMVQRANGIVGATVTAATELTHDEEELIRRSLEEMTGQRIELTVTVDPALIGGVAVRIGDRMIDASVRGRLERLRERLVAGAAA